jgi:O-antigen ligase
VSHVLAVARAESQGPPLGRVSRIVDDLLVLSTLALIAAIPIENVIKGPFSLSRLIGVPVILVFGLWLVTHWRLRIDRTAAIACLAFLSWVVLSYFWSFAPGATTTYILTFLQLGVLVLVIWQVCDTPARLRAAVIALATGGALGAVISIADQLAPAGGVPRYAIGDPNDFGVGLTMSLVASIHIVRTSRRTGLRLLWVVLAVLQVAAIVRTASRTALIALVVCLVISALDRAVVRPRVAGAIIVALGAALFVIIRLTSGLAVTRLSTTYTEATSGDLDNRQQKWNLALNYWNDVPLQGLGGAGYRQRAARDGYGTAVHSVPVGVLTELGIIGLLLFVAVVLVALHRLYHCPDKTLRLTLAAIWACWFIGSLSLTLEIRKMLWILVAISTCQGIRSLWQADPVPSAGRGVDPGDPGGQRVHAVLGEQ